MKPLKPLAPELRERLMQETGFRERLVAGELHQRSGVATVDIYSMDDLFALLSSPCPLVSVGDIARWCRDVLGDGELAHRIDEAAARETNDRNRLLHVRALVGERLLQCREAAQAV